MNCYFCKAPCVGTVYDHEELWLCHMHPYTVRHTVSLSYHKAKDCDGPDCCPQKTHFITTILWKHKDTQYNVNFWHYNGNKHFRVESSSNNLHILFLPYLPNIGPEDLDKRLPTWITFS